LSQRRSNLSRHLFLLPLCAAATVVASGCGEANPGKFPEPKYPGASRDGVTPHIPPDANKLQKISPKAKAAMKATAEADPRGR